MAELEFSFGRVPEAKKALAEGLRLSPRNPAAHALEGFLLAAENNVEAAKKSFDEARAIDGALGNAWLGRGLYLIRRGEDELGRQALQTAAALEPNRSIFHSYLGKAFSNVGDEAKTALELKRARSRNVAAVKRKPSRLSLADAARSGPCGAKGESGRDLSGRRHGRRRAA